jgi:hypothetical protein
MARSVVLGILGGVAFVALIGALLFGSAGGWDLPLFWAYLGAWAAAVVVGPLVIDPTLAGERFRRGLGSSHCRRGADLRLGSLWGRAPGGARTVRTPALPHVTARHTPSGCDQKPTTPAC